MLLKNELKKLYIKQYGLIVLLIVFIVKLLTSADLYKASYSDMLYEQQKYYLEYMQEYGGQLTDEKETAIPRYTARQKPQSSCKAIYLIKTETETMPLPKNLQMRCGRYPT